MLPRLFALALVATASFSLSGCGGSSEPKASVTGQVMLNGKALPEGEIYFVTEGSGKAPEILTISNGNFSGEVTVGKKKIQINAYRDAKPEKQEGGYVPPDGGASKENYIPPEWNANSTRTEEVKAGQENKYLFEITKY